MSKDIKAFPSHGTMGEVVKQGMDLRDYFAAKAMQSIVNLTGIQAAILEKKITEKTIAEASYN